MYVKSYHINGELAGSSATNQKCPCEYAWYARVALPPPEWYNLQEGCAPCGRRCSSLTTTRNRTFSVSRVPVVAVSCRGLVLMPSKDVTRNVGISTAFGFTLFFTSGGTTGAVTGNAVTGEA